MKIKKIILVCLLMVVSMTPVQAKVEHTITIVSKQLPYIIYVQVVDEKHMKVRFIPSELRLPTPCKSDSITPLQSLDVYKDIDCVKETIKNTFHVTSENFVFIYLDNIANKLDLPYKDLDFKKISTMTDYFSRILKKLNVSMILNYSDYIESDLGIKDYYDYYTMFKGKRVSIDYSYVNLIYIGKQAIPLDLKFHTSKE